METTLELSIMVVCIPIYGIGRKGVTKPPLETGSPRPGCPTSGNPKVAHTPFEDQFGIPALVAYVLTVWPDQWPLAVRHHRRVVVSLLVLLSVSCGRYDIEGVVLVPQRVR
jgi:hypothetical protein